VWGSFGRVRRRAAHLLLLSACAYLAGRPAAGQEPLFSFVQISDSQPEIPEHQARFEQVLDTIVAAGSPGALIPRPVDFVLVAGDLVSNGETVSEWNQFLATIDSRLTAYSIPYRAVPGNHDVEEVGVLHYELFVAGAEVWDTDSATVYGQNGPAANTGWRGLRIIGFNNSNGGWNQISAEDLDAVSSRVAAADAAGENVFLLSHHPHDEFGPIPLAGVLENPSLCCQAHGHSGSPGARRGLASVANSGVWDLNSNSIFEEGAILYYEAYETELRVHVIELHLDPTELPAPETIALAHPLVPAGLGVPTAAFSATPVAGTAPLTVAFTDLSTGDARAWNWSFGDGATSTERHPSHSYLSPGVYDVSLVVSNAAGSSTASRPGLVSASPAPPVQTFLPTADARVKSSSPNGNYGDEPELRVRAADPVHRGYLRFQVTGVLGAPVESATLRLFALDGSNDGGALHAVATDWSESEISWNDAPPIGDEPLAGAGPTAAGQWREIDVSAAVQGDGAHAFALDSASTNSAYYSSREGAHPPELVVATRTLWPPLAEFGAAPTEGTAPLAVAFTDLSTGGPTSWLWDFGDGASSTEQSPSHAYAQPGIYDVTLVVTNAGGTDTELRTGYVNVAQGVATLVFAPVADAKVGSAKPAKNHGAVPDLWVKSGTWRSYLRFDVQGLGAPVLRATLRLFAEEGSNHGGAFYPVSGAWSEGTINWNTAPPLVGAPIASLGPVATGAWVEVDLTPVVAGDGSYAFGLGSPSTNLVYYGSRESANAPQLVIEVAD
jgi:PKD repeat protein